MSGLMYCSYVKNGGDVVRIPMQYNKSQQYCFKEEKRHLEAKQGKLESDIDKIKTYQKTGWCLFFNIITFFALRSIQALIINHRSKVLHKINIDLKNIRRKTQFDKFFETKYQRRHPGLPVGKAYKVLYAHDSKRLEPLYNHFLDEEIVKVCKKEKDEEHSSHQITIFRDEDDKVLIGANGRDGSEQACIWMLVADNGGIILKDSKEDKNYGMSDLVKFMSGAVSCDDKDSWIEAIRERIKEDESMIVYSGDSERKGLPFIIDEVLEDGNLQIRDPYHFWTIVVKPEAVRKRMNGQYTQIRRGRAK